MSRGPEVRGKVATSIATLLEHLGRRSQERADDPSIETPRATVLLASGEWVSGHVLAVSSARDTALVATGGQNFTLVRIDQVSAATVAADADIVELFGEVGPKPSRSPSKLELSRRLETLSASLTERLTGRIIVRVCWDDFPRTERAMTELGAVLADVAATLRGLVDDPLGREALDGLEAVELNRGEASGAILDDTVLRLVARVRGDRVNGPNSKNIEAAL